jgi:hypothetical protein
MMTGLLVIVAASGSRLAMPQGVPVVASTGAPQLIDKGPPGTTVVMTKAAYQRFVDQTGRASQRIVRDRHRGLPGFRKVREPGRHLL